MEFSYIPKGFFGSGVIQDSILTGGGGGATGRKRGMVVRFLKFVYQ